uniref:Uncharacterized protein n=1 Tax=Trichogramma kaykai TaxID=54128 RepID=A0ABD2X0Y8_9HYME
MERGKKMIVLPEDTYERLRTTNASASATASTSAVEGSMQTTGDNLSRLDASLYKIMNSDRYTDEYEKCKNYLQTLRRYLFFTRKEQMGDDDEDEAFDNGASAKLAKPMPVSEIIDSLPKTHRRDANLLLNHLTATNRIKWDNAGVVKIDNAVINNSSIADLIQSVLKKSAKAFLEPSSPTGQLEITRLLKETEAPLKLIKNPFMAQVFERPRNRTQPAPRVAGNKSKGSSRNDAVLSKVPRAPLLQNLALQDRVRLRPRYRAGEQRGGSRWQKLG